MGGWAGGWGRLSAERDREGREWEKEFELGVKGARERRLSVRMCVVGLAEWVVCGVSRGVEELLQLGEQV